MIRRRSGQASVEYLVGAVAVLIAVAVVAVAGQERCVQNFGGDLAASAGCRDVTKATALAMQNAVEEITFLLNLPF